MVNGWIDLRLSGECDYGKDRGKKASEDERFADVHFRQV
jgi:hypothetical protein